MTATTALYRETTQRRGGWFCAFSGSSAGSGYLWWPLLSLQEFMEEAERHRTSHTRSVSCPKLARHMGGRNYPQIKSLKINKAKLAGVATPTSFMTKTPTPPRKDKSQRHVECTLSHPKKKSKAHPRFFRPRPPLPPPDQWGTLQRASCFLTKCHPPCAKNRS